MNPSAHGKARECGGCGAAIRIEANGRCVIARTDDYGPDVCVERAVGGPILDVSPLVAQHLFGVRSAGWSDRLVVTAVRVATSTPLGPCNGNPPAPGGGGGAATCTSGTLDRQVPSGTCVQSAADRAWYRCSDPTPTRRWSHRDAGRRARASPR